MKPETGFTTQRIGPSKAAISQALGGEASRPPMPQAPLISSPKMEAARAAFTAANTTPAAPEPPAPIGHPTFDRPPADFLTRRALADSLRKRLGDLVRFIYAENAAIAPQLSNLLGDAEALKSGELFDPAAGLKLLTELTKTLDGISEEKSAKPTKPAKEAPPLP